MQALSPERRLKKQLSQAKKQIEKLEVNQTHGGAAEVQEAHESALAQENADLKSELEKMRARLAELEAAAKS